MAKMKLTENKLYQIIRESVRAILKESYSSDEVKALHDYDPNFGMVSTATPATGETTHKPLNHVEHYGGSWKDSSEYWNDLDKYSDRVGNVDAKTKKKQMDSDWKDMQGRKYADIYDPLDSQYAATQGVPVDRIMPNDVDFNTNVYDLNDEYSDGPALAALSDDDETRRSGRIYGSTPKQTAKNYDEYLDESVSRALKKHLRRISESTNTDYYKFDNGDGTYFKVGDGHDIDKQYSYNDKWNKDCYDYRIPSNKEGYHFRYGNGHDGRKLYKDNDKSYKKTDKNNMLDKPKHYKNQEIQDDDFNFYPIDF